MAKLQFVREATIYDAGLRLKVEVAFYKTVAEVHIFDDTLAFPCLDSYKVKGRLVASDFPHIVAQAREYAIKKGYFKHY